MKGGKQEIQEKSYDVMDQFGNHLVYTDSGAYSNGEKSIERTQIRWTTNGKNAHGLCQSGEKCEQMYGLIGS